MLDHLKVSDFSYPAVLAAGLLPYAFAGVAKFGPKEPYNNHDPRAFLETVKGKYKRAHNAQLNSFEGLPLFVAGVLIAHQQLPSAATQTQLWLNLLSWLYVTSRVVYGWAYITDRAALRSVVWFVGLSANVALFFI